MCILLKYEIYLSIYFENELSRNDFEKIFFINLYKFILYGCVFYNNL